jgi:hypothetical protein
MVCFLRAEETNEASIMAWETEVHAFCHRDAIKALSALMSVLMQ